MSKELSPDLQALVDLFSKKPATKKKKRQSQQRSRNGQQASQPLPPEEVHPLRTATWKNEAIVFLTTTTTCACGEKSTQTSPYPFIRRWNPKKLCIHEEALAVTPQTLDILQLPVIEDWRDVEISFCHKCLPTRPAGSLLQLDFFTETLDASTEAQGPDSPTEVLHLGGAGHESPPAHDEPDHRQNPLWTLFEASGVPTPQMAG